jgi:hypothetical protein
MFAEYARLLTSKGEALITLESFWDVALILGAGFILVFVGYKIKGSVGAIIALLIGTIVFLYVSGMLRF